MKRNQSRVAKVAAYAEMVDFPCTKQELLQMAEELQFPDSVLDVLEDLPNIKFTCESDLVASVSDLECSKGETKIARRSNAGPVCSGSV